MRWNQFWRSLYPFFQAPAFSQKNAVFLFLYTSFKGELSYHVRSNSNTVANIFFSHLEAKSKQKIIWNWVIHLSKLAICNQVNAKFFGFSRFISWFKRQNISKFDIGLLTAFCILIFAIELSMERRMRKILATVFKLCVCNNSILL